MDYQCRTNYRGKFGQPRKDTKNHKKISLITGAKSIITNYDRYVGYTKGIYENDIPLNADYIKFGRFGLKFGKKALEELISLEERPSAVIAGNSFMTAGILLKAREKKISIPEELSLISFGNISNSELITPKLTFIDERVDFIGKRAAELLLASLKNKNLKNRSVKINTEINEGASTAYLKN